MSIKPGKVTVTFVADVGSAVRALMLAAPGTLWVWDRDRAQADEDYERLVCEWARQEGLPVTDIAADPPLMVKRTAAGRLVAAGVTMWRNDAGRRMICDRGGGDHVAGYAREWPVLTWPRWLS